MTQPDPDITETLLAPASGLVHATSVNALAAVGMTAGGNTPPCVMVDIVGYTNAPLVDRKEAKLAFTVPLDGALALARQLILAIETHSKRAGQ